MPMPLIGRIRSVQRPAGNVIAFVTSAARESRRLKEGKGAVKGTQLARR